MMDIRSDEMVKRVSGDSLENIELESSVEMDVVMRACGEEVFEYNTPG